MSSSNANSRRGCTGARGTVLGAALIVFEAAVIGLAANALNPDRLPWIRVPLRETHRMATSQEVRPPPPPPPTATAYTAAPAPPQKVRAAASVPQSATTDAPIPVTVQPLKRTVKPVPAPSGERTVQPPIKTVPIPSPAAAPKKAEALFTSLTDAKALFDAKDTVFIDARHQEDYAAEHIAGARNLFADEFSTLYEAVLGRVPKDRAIVTYCSDPQCDAAIKLADALVARGHTRVFILLEGMPGWRGAGYPSTNGDAP